MATMFLLYSGSVPVIVDRGQRFDGDVFLDDFLFFAAPADEQVDAELRIEGFGFHEADVACVVADEVCLEEGADRDGYSCAGVEEVHVFAVVYDGGARDEFNPVEEVDGGREGGVPAEGVGVGGCVAFHGVALADEAAVELAVEQQADAEHGGEGEGGADVDLGGQRVPVVQVVARAVG